MSPPSTWKSVFARRTVWSGACWALGLVLAWRYPVAGVAGWFAVRTDPAALAFTAAAVIGGLNFFQSGWRALRGLRLDMTFLMSAAIVAALSIGEPFEAASLAFLFSLAELLERYATDRARRSVATLLELAPEQAEKLDASGGAAIVAADTLRVGDRIRIRPGQRIAADARVHSGSSAVNEAAVTGESLPAVKGPGSPVYSGTLNIDGTLDLEVTADAAHSVLARIAEMVRTAEGRRAPIEQTVQRFARIYTPLVVLAAVAVMALPPLLGGGEALTWFVRGVTLMVVACPCALVIATPVTVVSALTSAARHGVLIKGGEHLERLARVRALAMDKTGTLTEGAFEVIAVDSDAPESAVELMGLVASVESRSEHPIGRALVEHAKTLGVELSADVADFEATPGGGIRGSVNGVTVWVGTEAYVGRPRLPWGRRTDGAAQVLVRTSSGLAARIALRDRVRPGARSVVELLHRLGVRPVVMLTGDQPAVAAEVAEAVGIDTVHAALMPAEKVTQIRALHDRHGEVAMVGDGVNDAPALAEASVGVAMGAIGSPAAIETADVALMTDELSRVPYAIGLARQARRIIAFNIGMALALKMALALGAIGGTVSLAVAVLVGDLGGALVVTLNALRLGFARPAEG